jgi:sulfur-oxidizing protein SoxY
MRRRPLQNAASEETMTNTFAKTAVIAALAIGMGVLGHTGASAADDQVIWDSIRADLYGSRQVADGTGKISLDAPYRAEDASTVPLSVHLPADFAKSVKSLTLIVDKNPSPVVATFTYGDAAGKGDRVLATRVRIDQYSTVRAIAETTDGKVFMTTKFVKASGGCSAPAGKDPEEAAKTLGKMKIMTSFKDPDNAALEEAQVMIKHPNSSGMQMDQATGLYIPPHFVDKLEVKTGDKVIFTMTGGISISENPHLRFTYTGKPSDPMSVEAEDSKGNVFKGSSGQS